MLTGVEAASKDKQVTDDAARLPLQHFMIVSKEQKDEIRDKFQQLQGEATPNWADAAIRELSKGRRQMLGVYLEKMVRLDSYGKDPEYKRLPKKIANLVRDIGEE